MRQLAHEREQAYQRVVAVARRAGGDDYSRMISMALACAIEDDRALGAEAVRQAFHEYMNKTVEANVQSETHVFHNGWCGYKNWGAVDYFLHVLTAADAETSTVDSATAVVGLERVQVRLAETTITFATQSVGGSIESAGRRTALAEAVVLPYAQ